MKLVDCGLGFEICGLAGGVHVHVSKQALIPPLHVRPDGQLKTRLPVIPHTLFGAEPSSSSSGPWAAPRIWERHAYDTRFVSITTMNLNVPHNVFDSITGIEIEVRARRRQSRARNPPYSEINV